MKGEQSTDIIKCVLYLIVFIILCFIAQIMNKGASKAKQDQALPISGAYQKRPIFSRHEKDAYRKLKPIADEMGYILFTKVRLLDLLEPIKGNEKSVTYRNKVQSKHVDFVLCDEKLEARYIIELDDRSHDRPDRQERDRFVDEVLTSVGYKIFHVWEITEEIKKKLQ